MAKQLDPEQFEDVKEMMIYEVVLSEALVNLLDKKGLIKKAELLAEIKKIKAKTIEKAKTTEKKKTTVKKKAIGKKK